MGIVNQQLVINGIKPENGSDEQFEDAIAEVVVKMGLKKLPLLPSRHTFQMMARAAVENLRPEK